MRENTTADSRQPPLDAFEVHRQMVTALFVATVALSAALGVGLYLQQGTMLMVVVSAGALGGFVSALRRMYVFQRVFPLRFFKRANRVDAYLVIYSMIPSLVGGIAAVALYLIFAARLIEGGLFPSFAADQTPASPALDEFKDFVANWQPRSNPDYAKALVWSFIAGFSERFVPDILERLAASERSGGVKPASGDESAG